MHSRAKAVSITGILAALSAILYVWPNPPILPAFKYLELNFADLPALLAGTMVSPIAGIAVVLIRCAIHLTISKTMFVGELSNFIVSSGFVFVASALIGVKCKERKAELGKLTLFMAIASVCQLILAVFSNYFITLRLYGIAEDALLDTIVAGIIPFNAIKSVINSIIFIFIYKTLLPKIRRFI